MSSQFTHIPLTPIDHCPPPTAQPGLAYFAIKPGVSNAQVFAHLQEGLYKTFLQVPWLNGKIHTQAPDTPAWRPGQLEIRYNPEVDNTDHPKCRQLRFNELESTISFKELEASGFPIDSFEDESLTWVSYNPKGADFNAGVDIVAVQVNFIPGACLLVPSVHHAACDAIGMGIFLKIWGDCCQALSLESCGRFESVPMLPKENWDRTSLDRLWTKEATGHSIAEVASGAWQMIGLDRPSPGSDGLMPSPHTRPPPRHQEMSSRIFYMPATAFAKLRKEKSLELGTTDLSGNDVLLALLWRTLMRARITARGLSEVDFKPDLDSLAELQIVNDARADFSQELPQFYIGNCIFNHRPTVPIRALVDPDSSLALVAQAIRASARNMNHENIMDAYMLAKSMPDWTRLHPLRHLYIKDTWIMSSLIMVPDNTSFGDTIFTNEGRPKGYRMLMGNRNRSQVPACFVMPRKKHGGLELVLSVFEDEWPFVFQDKEFESYTFLLV